MGSHVSAREISLNHQMHSKLSASWQSIGRHGRNVGNRWKTTGKSKVAEGRRRGRGGNRSRFPKNNVKPLGKQRFQLYSKPTPPRADPGVLDPRRQIHDEPFENPWQNRDSPWLPREDWGRGDDPPLGSWKQVMISSKNQCKTIGRATF